MARTVVVGTAGHIDHGKSALVEALTGVHPDRLAEEKRRGITIELGFAHTRIGDVAVSFVDVPGHERFVRTMVAGAAGIDCVLLIVAANELVMPQTREHLAICRLLGIARGVIVLTKAELVDADTLALAEMDVRALVDGTFLSAAPIVITSARTGAGIEALRAAIVEQAASRDDDAMARPARVPIDRVFSVKGFGTVATGTLVSGALTVDEAVVLWPGARDARVRGLQVAGASVTHVEAPSRVAVNLGGVELSEVTRGMTIAARDALVSSTRADVAVEWLPHSPEIRHGTRVRWLQGTTEASARVSFMPPPHGPHVLARLRFDRPVAITRGDRFVLRLPAPAGTVGGGVIIDPAPVVRSVRRSGYAERVAALVDATPAQAAAAWVDEAGGSGMLLTSLAPRIGFTQHATRALAAELQTQRVWCVTGDRIVSRRAVDAEAAALTARLQAYHRAHPQDDGLARETARGACSVDVFTLVLAAAGIANAERLALPAHRPQVTEADSALARAVVDVVAGAGLQPPDVTTLAQLVNASAPSLSPVLVRLGRAGRLVKLGELWFAPEALKTVVDQVRARGRGQSFDVAAMKAQFGVSRKFAIPLLEYLDRERVTRRLGDKRVVL